MVEELIPITYHLSIENFERNKELIGFGEVPRCMMLIGEGICDVVWTPTLSPKQKALASLKNLPPPTDLGNPLNKFSESLHMIVSSSKKKNEADDQQNPQSEEFKVQRLMRGDALTVRALSSKICDIRSQMKIVAASKSVRVYSLLRSNLQYLPDNIRVRLSNLVCS